MSLPQINTPVHELKIPSTGRKVKYRPFVVREEKILLLALESENQEEQNSKIETGRHERGRLSKGRKT